MSPARPRPTPVMDAAWRAASALCFASFLVAALAAGGAAIQLGDPTLAAADTPEGTAGQELLAAAAATAALGLGTLLALRRRRRFVFELILWTSITATTAVLCEVGSGAFTPPWPARGLHGVHPKDLGAWAGRGVQRAGGIGVNGWGQRDRERSVAPAAGTRRIILIGDSFLEESSSTPLPMALEQRLARSDTEVINLGVSATGPDEYYWRLRNIALALRPAHVVVVLYAGNDFIEAPTMPTLLGIAAPYPKPSVLGALGLARLNHVLSNHRRPVLQKWRGAGDLDRQERQTHEALRTTDDTQLPRVLARAVPPSERPALIEFLQQRDLRAFYAGLRDPDAGLFRSYYLIDALRSWGPPTPGRVMAVPHRPAQYVLALVTAMAALCDARGVAFSLAIAPEASQVDPRFQRFWGAISHLKESKAPTQVLSDLLSAEARARGIAVVDLSAALRGVAGAYYNLDGHWSDVGVRVAAEALAAHLSSGMASPPGGP